MVISFCVCCLITTIFVMPLCYGWEIFSNKKLNTEHYGYIIILYFLAATFIIGFWRAWHIWYDIQYKMEAATNTWAKVLDTSEESNVFLKYKGTFGNSKWTKKYLIMVAICVTVIVALSKKICTKKKRCLPCFSIIHNKVFFYLLANHDKYTFIL